MNLLCCIYVVFSAHFVFLGVQLFMCCFLPVKDGHPDGLWPFLAARHL